MPKTPEELEPSKKISELLEKVEKKDTNAGFELFDLSAQLGEEHIDRILNAFDKIGKDVKNWGLLHRELGMCLSQFAMKNKKSIKNGGIGKFFGPKRIEMIVGLLENDNVDVEAKESLANVLWVVADKGFENNIIEKIKTLGKAENLTDKTKKLLEFALFGTSFREGARISKATVPLLRSSPLKCEKEIIRNM